MAPLSTTAKSDPRTDNPPIKTTCPDISIGLYTAAVVEALECHGINAVAANDFLDYLQQTMCRRKATLETLHCSESTQRACTLRFPSLVVEAKSYATGNPVYDVQNQAAVSGACALEILPDLAELAACAEDGSSTISPENAKSVVFSICTEGPHDELWTHYTTIEHGVRVFDMSVLKTYHISPPDGVLDCLVAVDNVLAWGVGIFLEGVVDQVAEFMTLFRILLSL